jgi:hypothetical protein
MAESISNVFRALIFNIMEEGVPGHKTCLKLNVDRNMIDKVYTIQAISSNAYLLHTLFLH